jgi:hypothetical protein
VEIPSEHLELEAVMSVRRRVGAALSVLVLAVWVGPPASAAPGIFVLDGRGGQFGRTTHAIGRDTANAVFEGDLFVLYHDATSGNLRMGRRTDHWAFATIDGAGGTNGRVNADVGSDVAAAAYGGALHVFYRDDTGGNLRHAWFDGTAWAFQTLDGAGGTNGRLNADVGTSISVTAFGAALHVFYVDRTHSNVRRARLAAGWTFATIDGAGGTGGRIAGDVGYNTATAVYDGTLHVYYFLQDPFCDPDVGCRIFGTIRQASLTSTGWTARDVREINCCFEDLALSVAKVSDSSVWLFYQNFGVHSTNLRHLHWNGASWVQETSNGLVEEAPFDGESLGYGASPLVFGGRPYVYYLGFGNPDGPPDGVRQAFWNGSTFVVANIGVNVGYPTSSRVRSGLRLVFLGEASIPVDEFQADDLVQVRLLG